MSRTGSSRTFNNVPPFHKKTSRQIQKKVSEKRLAFCKKRVLCLQRVNIPNKRGTINLKRADMTIRPMTLVLRFRNVKKVLCTNTATKAPIQIFDKVATHCTIIRLSGVHERTSKNMAIIESLLTSLYQKVSSMSLLRQTGIALT